MLYHIEHPKGKALELGKKTSHHLKPRSSKSPGLLGNNLNALLISFNHANRLVKFGVVNGTERVVKNVIDGILGGV